MSLDIYLTRPESEPCLHCGRKDEEKLLYDCNITHNLNRMAEACGIYKALWRPEEIGITKAGQLIDIIEEGLRKLKDDPEYYESLNSPNGWGTYKHFVPFVERYLEACKQYPDAIIEVSR